MQFLLLHLPKICVATPNSETKFIRHFYLNRIKDLYFSKKNKIFRMSQEEPNSQESIKSQTSETDELKKPMENLGQIKILKI